MYIDKLAQDVVQSLREKNLRVSFAESCTGGMISSAIVSVPGSSSVLDLSIVTYANRAKIEFTDVTQDVLDNHGAVSRQTALLMASGIKRTARCDIGVGVTGIAGPDGGSDSKPVGTVYIAVNNGDDFTVKKFNFSGNRQEIRTQTTIKALEILYDFYL
jgi:PncC family amidohydrolase